MKTRWIVLWRVRAKKGRASGEWCPEVCCIGTQEFAQAEAVRLNRELPHVEHIAVSVEVPK